MSMDIGISILWHGNQDGLAKSRWKEVHGGPNTLYSQDLPPIRPDRIIRCDVVIAFSCNVPHGRCAFGTTTMIRYPSSVGDF